MKYVLSLLLLISLNSFSQNIETKLVLNARNAKTSKLFDYYAKNITVITIDSTYAVFDLMGLYERQNGTILYAYNVAFTSKYSKLDFYKNRDKAVNYYSISLYYPIKPYLKIGYDLTYNLNYMHSIYVKYEYKFIEVELCFLNKFNKINIEFVPSHKVKNFYIGIDSHLLYINNAYKWNFGVSFKSTFSLKKRNIICN